MPKVAIEVLASGTLHGKRQKNNTYNLLKKLITYLLINLQYVAKNIKRYLNKICVEKLILSLTKL